MSNPWFRMYVDFLDDAKVISLAFEDQRHFIGLLALKCADILDQPISNSKLLDRIVAQKLWIDYAIILDVKKRLIDAELIDENWQPLAWDKRQYKSDSSTERVKRYREKRKEHGLPAQVFISPSIREDVFKKNNYSCVYCKSKDDLTIDHKTPPLRGGSNSIDNLQTLCRSCNASKRDMTHEEYLERNESETLLKRYRTDTEQNTDTEKPNTSLSESCDSNVSEIVEKKQKRNGVPYQAIVNLYHEQLPMCPKVEILNSKRKGQISARWNSGELDTLESWRDFFIFCRDSKFLIGATDPSPGRKRFIADLEWLTKETSYTKIVEGKYHNG